MNKKDAILNYLKLRYLRCYLRAFSAPRYVYKAYRQDMIQYKDRYKGKRCFIIGNGPSLNEKDLDLIEREYSFAANRIYKIFEKTSWRPTFYCVQDMNVASEMGREIEIPLACAEHSFFRMKSFEYTEKITKSFSNVSYVPIVECLDNVDKIKFSDKADRYLYDGWTVTYMAIQLAVYMGFNEIYLIGVDHSFPFELKRDGKIHVIDKNRAAHFYETAQDNQGENGAKRRTNFRELVTFSYEAAERYSKKSGKFRIYNATRGGELEVFERVSLEDILNGRKSC